MAPLLGTLDAFAEDLSSQLPNEGLQRQFLGIRCPLLAAAGTAYMQCSYILQTLINQTTTTTTTTKLFKKWSQYQVVEAQAFNSSTQEEVEAGRSL